MKSDDEVEFLRSRMIVVLFPLPSQQYLTMTSSMRIICEDIRVSLLQLQVVKMMKEKLVIEMSHAPTKDVIIVVVDPSETQKT